MSVEGMVKEFHRAFGLPIRFECTENIAGADETELRMALLDEEFQEYWEAEWLGDLVSIADALADMVYVIYGTALTYGIDLDAVIREVHRSNMTKLGEDGKPLYRFDGKVKKGPNYEPPNIAKVLGIDPDNG